jgi:hypothetical protein
MITIKTDLPPVCVCVPSSTLTRYLFFEMSLEGLYVPPNTDLYRVRSSSPAKNRNEAIRMGMQRKEITHWFFVDDDHHFDSDVMMKLLNHKVPFVSSITCLSMPPFAPVVYKGERTLPNGNKQVENYTWKDLDSAKGLLPVFAVGGTGLLIERSVLEKMKDPWFELGKTNPEECGEDIYFCQKLREAGVPLYLDVDTVKGHVNVVAIWPVRDEKTGQWMIELVWETGERVRLGRKDSPAVQRMR